jgi:hypothetical protein
VRAAIASGAVRQVRQGVLCSRPDSSPFECDVVAALLRLPDGTLAAGLTAARLWGFDALIPVSADERLCFLVPGRTNRIRLAGCDLRFTGHSGVGLPSGIPATSRARTILDVVAEMQFVDGVALVEAALHADPDLADELRAERARRVPRRGSRMVEQVLDFAGPYSESVLESRARVLFHTSGLPWPVQQATIRSAGHFVARVDFLWPARMLVVEVDGLSKYADSRELQREKERQNKLVALGYRVLRFTWADLTHRPDWVVRQIRSALAA